MYEEENTPQKVYLIRYNYFKHRGEPNTVCASRAGQENECQDLTDQEDEWNSLVHFLVCNFSVARKLIKLE